MKAKKNPEISIEKKKGLFFQIGLVISLLIVFVAFEYKSYDKTEYNLGSLNLDDLEEEIIPITSIDHFSLGDGKIGPITDNIRQDYFNIVRNPNADHKEWRTLI